MELDGLDPRLARLTLEAAVDVDNPLLGRTGCQCDIWPTKGASPEDVEQLDRALSHFADISAQLLGDDYRTLPGAGAAGWDGVCCKSIFKCDVKTGIEMIMQQANMATLLARADLVITGEGRLDGQSLAGKTPIGVSRAAQRFNKPVIVLAGSLGDGWQACFDEGVTAAFALADGPMTLNNALPRTAELLEARCESLLRLWVHKP
ncbi:hypothetical protein HSBAA_54150 [Vreelandella sulfidaeris]|uniref:Glycerate kinase n=1 Tax=Vreelandella sulfidaeris TaxID=115553 RepID=A0A455UIQ8_9GAMM|nr:hypothetical protein HSBAA_54150 [Halomonas sulfidaeris]